MPKQKERQDASRTRHDTGRTLNHFFSKKPEPSSTNPPPFPKRQNTALKPRPSNKSLNSNSEVIVIDSDDEHRNHRRGPFPIKCASDDQLSAENQPPKSTLLAASSDTISTFTFGEPYLLTKEATVTQPNPSFAFGNAGNLNGEGRDPNEFCLNPRELRLKKEEENTQVDIDLSEDPTEEWLMGDDEIVNSNNKGGDDDEEVEFVESTLVGGCETLPNTVCPCCEKQLAGQQPSEIQAHINHCLDSSTSGNSHRPSTNSEPSTTSKPSAKISTGNNAFSVLMSSFKENEAWKEATSVEDKSFKPVKSNGGRRKAPFYKVLQGMPISVDAFRYGAIPGVTAYFLSHAHSDHYTNLSSSWKSGPIYCSQGTANLIIHMLSVDKKWVRPLPMDTPTIIPDTDGVQVTLIEANHCPGSCLFLFEGKQTVNAGDSTFLSPFVGSPRTFRYLHCGDFRASPRHIMHPAIKGKKIDHVYLDTTYLDPKYTFPAQPLVISACAELSRRLLNGEPTTSNSTMKSWLSSLPSLNSSSTGKGRTLVVVGTYSIGKERIVKAVARALGSKVYCDSRKAAILRCEGDDELLAMLTTDPLAATVHVVPLGTIATDRLKIYMDRFKGAFTRAIGFRPTGWTYSQPSGMDLMPSVVNILTRTVQKDFNYTDLYLSPKSSSTIQVYGVPYSEHSSFYELTCFAMSFNWTKMIATVNVGSESSRGKMSKWVERWESEKKKRGAEFVVTPRHEDYW
ncbi:hypothetical protein D9756_002257 [Leucocoprinus leucothites]|uniref:DNA repair metallo-beta-lactamase domain-containing protein n=1 Tax=Leucocoprinus leucothites TaxID=201217 RepID=A0A8H5LLQ7_9AGAR|nr:hypothetical protein D9756_002257 [Leucoagaricus leucothites]